MKLDVYLYISMENSVEIVVNPYIYIYIYIFKNATYIQMGIYVQIHGARIH